MQKNSSILLNLLVFMMFIGCLSQIASDIYAPSLPAIAVSFHSPISLVQLSMSFYMCAIAFSLFIYGPLSDALGRKKPLISGLTIMFLGTLVCLFAPNITALLLGRILQGLGVGACAGLWRSIFRDRFSGDDMAKYGSYLSIIIVLVIPAAPTLGGYIQHYIGWRGTFLFLALYTLAALYIVIFQYKETSQHHHISRLQPCFILKAFRELFTHKQFMGYTLCVFLTYGAFFSWFTVSPVLLIHSGHLNPVTYGWLNFLCGSTAMGLGSFVNGRLVKKLGKNLMLQLGWSIMIFVGCMFLLTYYFLGVNVIAIFTCVFLLYFGVTLIWPNTFAGAMENFGHLAGYAGSMYSALQLGGGGLIGVLASHLPATTQIPLGWIIIGSATLALVVFRYIVSTEKRVLLNV